MSSESIIEEQKAANLARIRDNQRRSRARRKEYLQELEERYRVCEQIGVEASAEMQAAARRVIEENRYLRSMLKQHGYTDADIDRATQQGTSGVSAVAGLEALFGQRRRPPPYEGPSGGQVPSSSSSSSQPTPSIAGARHLQSPDTSQINHLYPAPYPAGAGGPAGSSGIVAGSSSMPGPSMAPHGVVYGGEQTQWPGYASHHPGVMPSGPRMTHQYDDMPSIQSIKSEIGYGPQEEIDCQSADAEFPIAEEQTFDMSKRYPR